MKRIYLLRHAKAQPADEFPGKDGQRPLTDGGRQDALRLGRQAASSGWRPERILCSEAARAQQTAEALVSTWAQSPTIEVDAGLYEAGPGDILERLRALPDTDGSVLVVGHNPTAQEVSLYLAGTGDPEAYTRMRAKFPTATLAVLDAEVGDWADLGPGCAVLRAFIRGAELA